MAEEIKFANGLFYHRPHTNAPDFVLGKISIKKEEFLTWLDAQDTQEGWVRLDILQPKDASKNPYVKLDDYVKPDGDRSTPTTAGAPVEDPEIDKLPF